MVWEFATTRGNVKYAYEDLSPEQLEEIVVHICRKLLGISVIGFAKGPDGGRDARFHGTAQLHPSTAAPWVGRVIIQAKHTNGYNKAFMESDFFSATGETAILAKEIPRIKKLRGAGELDHYMLFANRTLSGNGDSTIRKHVSSFCGVPEASIFLCGVGQIESYLKSFPDIADTLQLDLIETPLIVSPEELAEVVEAFAKQRDTFLQVAASIPTRRISLTEKNKLNGMSEQYEKEQRRRFLKETRIVQEFLADPENARIRGLYEIATMEFNLKILAKRKSEQTFDVVLEYLYDLLIDRDPILRGSKKLTRAVLYYMYWNCDIGAEANVTAN
jgi:hypothetical protein